MYIHRVIYAALSRHQGISWQRWNGRDVNRFFPIQRMKCWRGFYFIGSMLHYTIVFVHFVWVFTHELRTSFNEMVLFTLLTNQIRRIQFHFILRFRFRFWFQQNSLKHQFWQQSVNQLILLIIILEKQTQMWLFLFWFAMSNLWGTEQCFSF